MRRFIGALGLAAVIAAGSVPAVAAVQPVVIELPVLAYYDPFVCDADPIIHVSYDNPFRLTLFVDRSGSLVRDVISGSSLTITFRDPGTGRSLASSSPAPFTTTYDADGMVDEVVIRGLSTALRVPGEGLLLLDTGRIVFDGGFALGDVPTLERGPHAYFGTDDRATFCAWFRA